MNKWSYLLADYLIISGAGKNQEREMYAYAFRVFLEMFLSSLTCLIISIIFNMFIEGIIFWGIFIPLRIYAGGLHLERYRSCYIFSFMTFVLVLLVSKYVTISIEIAICAYLILALWIILLYPVDHYNRPVEADENTYFKRKVVQYLLIDFIILLINLYSQNVKFILIIITTLMLVVLTMIIGKYKYYCNKKY